MNDDVRVLVRHLAEEFAGYQPHDLQESIRRVFPPAAIPSFDVGVECLPAVAASPLSRGVGLVAVRGTWMRLTA